MTRRILAPDAAPPRSLATMTIHSEPCARCPSAPDRVDDTPEVADILTWPREQQIQTVFPCAWRWEKLCKGYCDALSVTEADLVGVPRSEVKP